MPHPRTNLALAGRAVKAEPPAALYDGGASAICLAMSLLKIARMGNPVLRQKAAAVDDPQAPAPWRIVVFFVSGERLSGLPGDVAQQLTVLINPVVEPVGEERAFGWEGCLSVPGMRGLVPRHLRIRYHALDLDGNLVEREAAGFHARVVQHECDHLDGILYPQRLVDLRHLFFMDELERHPVDLAEFLGETLVE